MRTGPGTAAGTRLAPVAPATPVEGLVLDRTAHAPGRTDPDDRGRSTGWDQAWARALDALELDVEQVERDLVHAHLVEADALTAPAPWQPPADLGPLPVSLRERAQAVLDRQLDAARRTAEALVASRRHAQVSQAMRPRQVEVPVYLDTDA
ncbi:hypothetical protein [Cellulomonas soli]|uniref:Uncharacterized protein n=1 Tax=Cellulomonas soli TaxID=931535 RepID=A0A512PEN8_9CELL|nr:hypothetical protein [Cellulomonas soli]NYI59531.1 hypothetical protein [Cellulomonas soli]GEP69677.1 hypothetical protein CSO01_23920 [Cellulomonas soli]